MMMSALQQGHLGRVAEITVSTNFFLKQLLIVECAMHLL
jgi:hypothetical protein